MKLQSIFIVIQKAKIITRVLIDHCFYVIFLFFKSFWKLQHSFYPIGEDYKYKQKD